MHLDLLGLDVERSELQEDVLGVDGGRRFLKKDRPLFQPYSKEKAKHCNEVCEPKRSQCGYVSQQQINMANGHKAKIQQNFVKDFVLSNLLNR